MNHLNSPNPKDIITQVLQEILVEDPNYFSPNSLNILTWKSTKVKGALITKIGKQRYLGCLRKDSKGQEYWKYKLLITSENSENQGTQSNSASAGIKPEQQSVEQEQSPDNFAQSELLEQNPQVQKFREKYGTPNQSQKST